MPTIDPLNTGNPARQNIAGNVLAEGATNLLQDLQDTLGTENSGIAFSNAIEKQTYSNQSGQFTPEQIDLYNAASPVFTTIEKQNKSIESAQFTIEQLAELVQLSEGAQWPQNKNNPEFGGSPGFLPPILISPTLESFTVEGSAAQKVTQTFADYKYVDWRGFQIDNSSFKTLETKDRFDAGRDLPKSNSALSDKPHSRRDIDIIYGDGRTDYFRNNFQVIGDGRNINNLTPFENPLDGKSELRLKNFKETPWENQDPPMFGFDVIFDTYSSPLLNGSLRDFIVNYKNVSEIASKFQVYEEFRNQFQKFFRLDGDLKIDPKQIAMTSLGSDVAAAESSSSLFNPHKKNYLGHYIKKITGLDGLIESNKGDTVKYLPDYKKDFITLEIREDVSMNVGTLVHLYKTLYWSRPNGKFLIPENLLRFNCTIIVSECRNFRRIKRGIANPKNIYALKDNLSRYVYTLRDCQFYFDKLPLEDSIDIGDQGPKMFESYNINFDYKYSTVKLERFVPNGDWGNYVGYDGGAIWKVGNKGTRNSRGTTGSQELSTPQFFTVGPDNKTYAYLPNLKINGEEQPYIIEVYGPDKGAPEFFPKSTPAPQVITPPTTTPPQNLGETGAGNTGNLTTTPGGGDIPGGGTVPTEGANTGPSLDNLKNQSQKITENAKEQAEIASVQTEVSSRKKISFGGLGKQISNIAISTPLNAIVANKSIPSFANVSKQIQNIAINNIPKSVSTALSTIVANKSILSDIVPGNFFDKMGSLKSNLVGGGILGSLGGLKDKILSGVPSLDSVKTQFSEAKTKVKSGFFDIRGDLKSSLEDSGSAVTGLFGSIGGLKDKISLDSLGGLKDKILSGVPSLDSVKTQFSEAKTKAKSGFFDVRGDLKSSLENSGSAVTGLFDSLGGLKDKISLGGLKDKILSGVPSLDSIKTQFSEAKTKAKSGFFDVRGDLKSSLEDSGSAVTGLLGSIGGLKDKISLDSIGGLKDKILSGVPSLDSVKTKFSEAKTKAKSGFFDIRGDLKSSLEDSGSAITEGLGGLKDKILSGVPSLDSVKTKFSEAKTKVKSGFFDVRGDLKSSLEEGGNSFLTTFDSAINEANSLTEQFSKKKNDTIDLIKGIINKEIEETRNNVGSFISVDNIKEKFSNAKEVTNSSFFDVRSQISGEKGGDTSSLNLRKKLLNNTIEKVYNGKKTGTSPIKSNTPPPTSFFDLKGQLKDFLGGNLGDKLTE